MLLTLTNNVARNANMSMTESDNDFITPENVPNRKRKKLLAKIDGESDDEMSEEGKTESRPVKTNANIALLVNEVIQFLKNANTKYKRYLSTAPVVQPQGGMLFLFDLGSDKKKWELMQRKMR